MQPYERSDITEKPDRGASGESIRGHLISSVVPGSIADELGVEPGDRLLEVDDTPLEDVFDYRFLIHDTTINVLIEKKDGELWELEIEKDYDEDPGLVFDSALMDEYRRCRNRCIFCFIDQMPPGMRDTLYFKDDDSRLSYLQGNYVTLTNMSDSEIDRIIRYRLEPVNISFHTLEEDLRCRMLGNRFAGEALKKAERMADAGIEMNGQIVLCKGVNDEEHLDISLKRLERYLPSLKSVSVVPVGLTRYRDGLAELEPFSKEDALKVLAGIEKWQSYYLDKYDTRLVHASDEWYSLAGRELPESAEYEGYLQLENGVGMLRLLIEETKEALSSQKGDDKKRSLSIATGYLAFPYIRDLVEMIKEKYPALSCTVYPVKNDFFGPLITVSGLVTGQDLIRQLSGRELGERLLIPCNMLRFGEDVFLDDVTVGEAADALQTKVIIVESSGHGFINSVLNGGEDG